MAIRKPQPSPAAAADSEVNVDLVLAEYNPTYLQCRDLMHAWDVVGHFRTAGWASTKRLVRCARCGMERYDQDDGVTVQHRYNQPDGYKIEGVRLSKREVRQEQLRRAAGNIWDSEEEMRKALRKRKPRTARTSNVVSIHRSA